MQDATAVANFFIEKAYNMGLRDLNPPKLHELVFCAHGWHLGILSKPLLGGHVLATSDGPVIEALTKTCSGTRRIDQPITVMRADTESGRMVEEVPRIAASEVVQRVLSITWKAYGRLSAYDLSLVTREPGGPWDLVWNDESRTKGVDVHIPNETIRLWFRALAERNRKVTKSDKLEDTQRILVAPDPDRLRSA